VRQSLLYLQQSDLADEVLMTVGHGYVHKDRKIIMLHNQYFFSSVISTTYYKLYSFFIIMTTTRLNPYGIIFRLCSSKTSEAITFYIVCLYLRLVYKSITCMHSWNSLCGLDIYRQRLIFNHIIKVIKYTLKYNTIR
jgi:hypothetical protein